MIKTLMSPEFQKEI